MKFKNFTLIQVITAAVAGLLLCSQNVMAQKITKNKDLPKYEAQVEEVMQKLSLREKVAQLFVLEISRNPSDETRAFEDSLARDYGVGNVILMMGTIKEFAERMNHLQSLSKIPILVATDGEWGAAMRFSEYLPYPRQGQIARIEKGAEKLLYKMGRNVAKELKDINIYVNYAPVVDVHLPGHPTYSQRSFGTDPVQTTLLGDAYMRGMQDEGIYACGKHFPGHGRTTVDSHYDLPVITDSKEVFDSIDLPPYKKMIDNGLEMIMLAHISAPGIDPSGTPMSISKICIDDLLKKELGFKGVILTDAIPMKGLSKDLTPMEANLAVYKAGSDMLLMSEDAIKSIEAITDSLKAGVFSIDDLNQRVRKVLMLKARAGYFEKGYSAQITDLDKKIAAARRRDARLIKKMVRKIRKSKAPYLAPVNEDPTLVLDKAGR